MTTTTFQFNGRGELKYLLILTGLLVVLVTPVAAETESAQNESPNEFGLDTGADPDPDAAADAARAEEDGSDDSATVPDESMLLFDDPEAGDDETDPQLGEGIGAFGIWDLVRMVVVLGLVIGAVYGVFFLLRRTAGGRFRNTELIKLLGSQPLPGNRSLHLVQVGSQLFLVGSADSAVNLVSEINDKETIDEIRLSAGNTEEQAESRRFSELISAGLRSVGRGTRANGGVEAGGGFAAGGGAGGAAGSTRGQPGAAETGSEDALNPVQFMSRQRERLRNLR